MLTPETLPRHELIGLHVRVAAAANPDLVGIAGRVVGETTQMLRIEVGSRVTHVPKQASILEFGPIDEAAADRKEAGTASKPAGEDAAYVTVDGARLLSHPALRTETTGDSKWR
ncbi:MULTISPECIES: ribonuclease P protein component 1 [unclassified Haladaptatus]|uniref:ribonuclease P protein component 1 n=1 Tax=unclassified Haladaptatus TaxID=2622732 RepID=UPI0023E8BB33|nr:MULTISPECIES: ribonuclease P protein component 1 [unclassified Haladaptatus]